MESIEIIHQPLLLKKSYSLTAGEQKFKKLCFCLSFPESLWKIRISWTHQWDNLFSAIFTLRISDLVYKGAKYRTGVGLYCFCLEISAPTTSMNLCRIYDGRTREYPWKCLITRARVNACAVVKYLAQYTLWGRRRRARDYPCSMGGLVFRTDGHRNLLISFNSVILIVVGAGIRKARYSLVLGRRGLRCSSRWLRRSLRSTFD